MSSPAPALLAATRVAPTPSGFLHAGNAISFLLTSALAERMGASLRLRIDDLDQDRVREAYLEDIFESLHWLGIVWQHGPKDADHHRRMYSQSLRSGRYHAMLDELAATGSVYACTCTRAQALPVGTGTVCGGGCEAMGSPFDAPTATLRLRVPPGTVVRIPAYKGGWGEVDLHASLGHPVLRQRPGPDTPGRPAYQVASLADDLDMRITHIVRGVDLLPSTACQLYMAELLGRSAFLNVRFLHHELVLDARGSKLSKSAGAASLKAMRERGEGPEELRIRAKRLIDQVL